MRATASDRGGVINGQRDIGLITIGWVLRSQATQSANECERRTMNFSDRQSASPVAVRSVAALDRVRSSPPDKNTPHPEADNPGRSPPSSPSLSTWHVRPSNTLSPHKNISIALRAVSADSVVKRMLLLLLLRRCFGASAGVESEREGRGAGWVDHPCPRYTSYYYYYLFIRL